MNVFFTCKLLLEKLCHHDDEGKFVAKFLWLHLGAICWMVLKFNDHKKVEKAICAAVFNAESSKMCR